MTHHDTGRQADGATHTYKGYRVTDHTVGVDQFNDGEVEGDVDLAVDGTGDVDEE
jgi:hypothetical protein